MAFCCQVNGHCHLFDSLDLSLESCLSILSSTKVALEDEIKKNVSISSFVLPIADAMAFE